MSSSALSDAYKQAFRKRLEDREKGQTTKPTDLTGEQQLAYRDADIAFNAREEVNESVKSKSAKYRKAYHQRILNLFNNKPKAETTENAEVNQAIQNAETMYAKEEFIPDLIFEKALIREAEVELETPNEKENNDELVYNATGELTGEARIKALAEANAKVKAEVEENREKPVQNASVTALVKEAIEEENEEKDITEITLKYKYDPEFGTQISDRKQMILLLKKALKDLETEEKRQLNLGVKKYSLPTNLYSLLLQFVLNPEIKMEDILKIQFEGWNTTRSRTSLFEALWIVVIGLGFLEKFPIENIQLVDWRNVNKEQAPEVFRSAGNSSKLENILNVLKSMPFGTRAGGVSDITFFYSTNPEELKENPFKEGCGKESCIGREAVKKVFISSVKFFELDIKKNIDKFDIAPLIAATDILAKENMQYEILLFVKDSRAVSNIVDQARKKYLANKVRQENIFGEQHLLAALTNLRAKILGNEGSTLENKVEVSFGVAAIPKSFLSLRFHQELIVEKAYHYISNSKDIQKTVLIGVLPRGGKTYICGGFVTKLQPKNVLVLTHVPKETHKQFINDLFLKFADFSSYEVKYLKEEGGTEDYNPNKKYIIFTSYQLLKTAFAQLKQGKDIKRKLLKALVDKTLLPDVCFLDEAHFGSAGNEAQEIYKTFDPKTIRILMTATYIRPFYLFNILPNQLFHWDYEDIQLGKKLMNGDSFRKFRERHLLEGESESSTDTVFDKVLEIQRSKGNTLEAISRVYSKFPNIEIINTTFEEKAKEAFSGQLLEDGSKGFSMESILAVNSKKPIPSTLTNAYTLFENPAVVGKFLNYIQPREGSYLTTLGGTSVEHIEGDLSYFNIMDRIYFDSSQSERGNRLTKGVPHTQIWFIPPSNGIQKRILALASLLLQHPWFSENFCVIGVSGGESDKIQNPGEESAAISINTFSEGKCLNISCASSDDLKACIENQERKNRCAQKPKGTIILTGYMLRMGISLGCADVVMLFDDDENPDSTIQKMFRALTESEGKEKSYVVDLNPRRSIKAICDHVRGVKEKPNEVSSNVYTTVINTFGINSDRFLIPSPGGKVIKYSELLTNIQRDSESAGTSKNIRDLIKDSEDLRKALESSDITESLRSYFTSSYLSSMDFKQQKEREKKEKREGKENNGLGGTGKERLKLGNNDSENNSTDTNTYNDIAPVKSLTPAQRFNNFIKIIDTTLKLVAFSTNASTIEEVYNQLAEDEIRDLLYSTLIQRGLINEIMLKGHVRSKGLIKPPLSQEEQVKYEQYNDEQKTRIIDDIQDALSLSVEKKPNLIYRGMKKKVNDKKVDQQKILEYIDDNLAPTTELKDEYGEVFTPMKLVNEMLDALEKTDPDIFTDKNKKWLDPANGMGNFPVAVFYRLMQKLKGVSTDPETRAEYIVKNMLYMVEIQKENSAKARRIFKKLAPGVDANILTCDTLTQFIVNKNFSDGTKEFDVIMGNPPFNPPKTETGSSGNSIWQNFVMKSYALLKEKGYLCFVHPPGWKKPTDEEFKTDKFKGGDYSGQIRQGQVWQVLKEAGVFTYIYTNDQKSKTVGSEYLQFFPAVDFYIYQKGGSGKSCNSKNIFIGDITESKNVKLNYKLSYLPNLITKESQDILNKITSEKNSLNFMRGIDERSIIRWEGEKIEWFYNANKSGFQYKSYGEKAMTKTGAAKDTVNIDKIVMNFGGGIDSYNVVFISKDDKKGVLDKTMYSEVSSSKEGKQIEAFLKSDIVKFIFLITQYASGAITQNEPLVANSISIPPEGTTDYYKYFDIEEHKSYIKGILAKYAAFKAPKRVAKTAKAPKTSKGGARFNKTRKVKRT